MCSGTISHVNGARYLIVSVPYVVVFYVTNSHIIKFPQIIFCFFKIKKYHPLSLEINYFSI